MGFTEHIGLFARGFYRLLRTIYATLCVVGIVKKKLRSDLTTTVVPLVQVGKTRCGDIGRMEKQSAQPASFGNGLL